MPRQARHDSVLRRGLALLAASCLGGLAAAGEEPIRADKPNAVAFPAREARFVRFVIFASSAGQACIDELEVYGPAGKLNLALAEGGAKASASSCLAGYAIHAIPHLNDGEYGNDHSWIAATAGEEWAQIELPKAAQVAKLVFSRDRDGRYADRVPIAFEIRLSLDGKQWTTVAKVASKAAAAAARPQGGFRGAVPPPPPIPGVSRAPSVEDPLRYAFLGEEHAWLKAYGRADLSPRLVPYNGRVKQYPRHVGDDVLPLPPLAVEPKLDGALDDPAWGGASRGVARVAWPYDWECHPLVCHEVLAGRFGDDLWLAIRVDRLLSSHVAVVSTGDGGGLGVVAWTEKGLVFKQNRADRSDPSNQSNESNGSNAERLVGAFNKELTCFEVRLPLSLFPNLKSNGLRVGLGMGGKHTPAAGRPVSFTLSSLAVAEVPPCANRTFRVRLSVPAGGQAVQLATSTAEGALALKAGETRLLSIPAKSGAIGPEFDLTVEEGKGERYTLHLFRYDPLGRTLALMEEMEERMRGAGTPRPQSGLEELRKRHERLLAAERPDLTAERQALYDVRVAKRRIFFRDPALAPLEEILFVKRQAYEPSHNYSVLLDSAYRGGGGVCRLDIPRRDGALAPDEATVVELFNAQGGIARDPVASFDAGTVYFGYRPSREGQFHLYSINADGSGIKQLTDGVWHDYYPCPLPDGGMAFVSSRCKARYLCWRPEVSLLFRMDADGSSIRPLSYSNLSEWAPSVMSDGRIIWTRSEYIDKGADFGHTLWAIRPDGSHLEHVFGNTIIQPNGYAGGREVPGTHEVCATLISHFGDLNGPIALLDLAKGRFNPSAITSLTPEVPWPGMWPDEEYFRDPFPVARDYFLVSHAPRRVAGLYVIDRFGNREVLHQDLVIGSMAPTPLRAVPPPPVLAPSTPLPPGEGRVRAAEAGARPGVPHPSPLPKGEGAEKAGEGEDARVVMMDVYRGIEPAVPRGTVKFIRIMEEVRSPLEQRTDGSYRRDHPDFMKWYAAPVDRVSGPFGWPSYVAKASHGLVPVEADGSASFLAPAGKTLYFQALDGDLNELQRMRSVVQFQPGENRSCIGCHESRGEAPVARVPLAFQHQPREAEAPSWGTGPLDYAKVVQPVWDARCVRCHDAKHKKGIDLTGALDADRIPASYRTLIRQGLVHVLDCGYNSGGNEKREPLTFGTLKSKLWAVLAAGHNGVKLTRDETHRVKCWIDMNCPLWPDYLERSTRPGPVAAKP